MAKNKNNKKSKSVEKPGPYYKISSAKIKDDFCNYIVDFYEDDSLIDTSSVKGHGIIDPDLKKLFHRFKAHMAYAMDVFKNQGIEVPNINKMHSHQIISDFDVTGFKIKGTEANEQIILEGSMAVTCGGRAEIKTPPIPLDATSSYLWHKELKKLADDTRAEVELYKEGKYTLPEEEEEEEEDPNLFEQPNHKGGEV